MREGRQVKSAGRYAAPVRPAAAAPSPSGSLAQQKAWLRGVGSRVLSRQPEETVRRFWRDAADYQAAAAGARALAGAATGSVANPAAAAAVLRAAPRVMRYAVPRGALSAASGLNALVRNPRAWLSSVKALARDPKTYLTDIPAWATSLHVARPYLSSVARTGIAGLDAQHEAAVAKRTAALSAGSGAYARRAGDRALAGVSAAAGSAGDALSRVDSAAHAAVDRGAGRIESGVAGAASGLSDAVWYADRLARGGTKTVHDAVSGASGLAHRGVEALARRYGSKVERASDVAARAADAVSAARAGYDRGGYGDALYAAAASAAGRLEDRMSNYTWHDRFGDNTRRILQLARLVPGAGQYVVGSLDRGYDGSAYGGTPAWLSYPAAFLKSVPAVNAVRHFAGGGR